MLIISRRSLLTTGLSLAPAIRAFSQAADPKPLTTAATGEQIPHPLAKGSSSVPDGMVYVPGGVFTMGERESRHEVHLDGFCIAKYLVTNAEYKAFADAVGHAPRLRHWRNGTFREGKANHPVLWVSWNDARQYCAWVSQGTGRTIAIPTEAQWGKAARGPKGYANPRQPQLNFNGVCARQYGLEVSADGSRGRLEGVHQLCALSRTGGPRRIHHAGRRVTSIVARA